MLPSIRKLVLVPLAAAMTLCAFAGSSANPSIVGQFQGSLFVKITTTINGMADELDSGSALNDAFGLEFKSDHTGVFNEFATGPWSKNGATYVLNVSKDQTAQLTTDKDDPNAKAVVKAKKIKFDGEDTLNGKLAIDMSFRQGLLDYHQVFKGVFGLARVP